MPATSYGMGATASTILSGSPMGANPVSAVVSTRGATAAVIFVDYDKNSSTSLTLTVETSEDGTVYRRVPASATASQTVLTADALGSADTGKRIYVPLTNVEPYLKVTADIAGTATDNVVTVKVMLLASGYPISGNIL